MASMGYSSLFHFVVLSTCMTGAHSVLVTVCEQFQVHLVCGISDAQVPASAALHSSKSRSYTPAGFCGSHGNRPTYLTLTAFKLKVAPSQLSQTSASHRALKFSYSKACTAYSCAHCRDEGKESRGAVRVYFCCRHVGISMGLTVQGRRTTQDLSRAALVIGCGYGKITACSSATKQHSAPITAANLFAY
jgi:hypothetical protein